jgi:hypothetical protein
VKNAPGRGPATMTRAEDERVNEQYSDRRWPRAHALPSAELLRVATTAVRTHMCTVGASVGQAAQTVTRELTSNDARLGVSLL